jgi:hypothetical protein
MKRKSAQKTKIFEVDSAAVWNSDSLAEWRIKDKIKASPQSQ